MIEDFIWQITLCEGAIIPTCQKETTKVKANQQVQVAADTNKVKRTTANFENDVKILIEHYGELCPAKHIVLDLDTACTLLNRDRHRVDAFAGLGKYLFQNYQTILKITSRKSH